MKKIYILYLQVLFDIVEYILPYKDSITLQITSTEL